MTTFVVALFLLFQACSSSTSVEEEEHADAEGLTLTVNGVEIVRVEEGAATGEITVEAGEETALITLRFLDHDGDEFQPTDEEFALDVAIGDESIAEFEQHDEDGKWAFHIHGEAAGSTEATFSLLHGDHADFESAPVTITVTAP